MHEHLAFCNDTCPVFKASRVLSGKWTTLIIRDLLSGKKRYSELLRSVEGVSPKMLASRLDFLEDKRLINRKVIPTVPITTEYSLTQLGKETEKVIYAMSNFGEKLRD